MELWFRKKTAAGDQWKPDALAKFNPLKGYEPPESAFALGSSRCVCWY